MPMWAIVVVVLAVFAIYVAAKIYQYNKDSKAAWDQVDKTKLREWDDEDEW